MENFPDEIKHRVFGYLDDEELARAGEINTEFLNLSRDEYLWKEKVRKRYGDVPKINGSWYQTYLHTLDKVYVVKYIDDEGTCNILGIYTKPDGYIIDDIVERIFAESGGDEWVELEDFHQEFMNDHPDSTIETDNPKKEDIDIYQYELNNFVGEVVKNLGTLTLGDFSISIESKFLNYK